MKASERRTESDVAAAPVVRAEFFRLIQHFGERGWVAVERFSDPLSARMVFRAEHYRRRATPLANEGDEMFLTVTETGGLQIEPGGGT